VVDVVILVAAAVTAAFHMIVARVIFSVAVALVAFVIDAGCYNFCYKS
jgi:hypothetical protein